MKFKMDLSGLKRLQRNARAMHGSHQVKLVDLFDGAFMRSNTRFSSLQTMVDKSGIDDFAAASEADKDAMVRKLAPHFSNWQEFLNAATVEYTKKQLLK
jgi:hypothetical protein